MFWKRKPLLEYIRRKGHSEPHWETKGMEASRMGIIRYRTPLYRLSVAGGEASDRPQVSRWNSLQLLLWHSAICTTLVWILTGVIQ